MPKIEDGGARVAWRGRVRRASVAVAMWRRVGVSTERQRIACGVIGRNMLSHVKMLHGNPACHRDTMNTMQTNRSLVPLYHWKERLTETSRNHQALFMSAQSSKYGFNLWENLWLPFVCALVCTKRLFFPPALSMAAPSYHLGCLQLFHRWMRFNKGAGPTAHCSPKGPRKLYNGENNNNKNKKLKCITTTQFFTGYSMCWFG